MALRFDLTKIKNFADVCYDKDGTMTGLATTLIWMLPVIGMPGITKPTARLVYLRLATYEQLFGPVRGEEYITMEDVLAHVGLTANVGAETDAKWERRILKAFKDVTLRRLDVAEERVPVLDRHRLDHGGTDNV